MKKTLSTIFITYFPAFGYYFFLLVIFSGCKKPYNPTVAVVTKTYLVVEGLINSGDDSTSIKLSRLVSLSSKSANFPLLYANVVVESANGDVFALKETGNGKYKSPGLKIDKNRSYRLHIKTSDGKEYASDYVSVQTTPPIDSVGFKINNNGLLIYANTHDNENKVQYYRWDYDEDWEFHAALYSKYIINTHLVKGKMVSSLSDMAERDASNQVFFCYKGDVSNNVVLATSASLKQAVIYQTPIISIPSSSEKIEAQYTILVRQYALTKDAYNFYTQLKKNTEQLGGIFDALPSQLAGNIHCLSNPAEPVIGFISVNNIQTKRIFIRRAQLPFNWTTQYPYACAAPFLVPAAAVGSFLLDLPHANLVIDTVGGLYAGTHECADCTIRGSTSPPPYWR